MGWLWYHKDPSEKTLDHLLRRLYSPEYLARANAEIIMARKVGATCFFAVKRPAAAGDAAIYQADKDGFVVTCDVIITKSSRSHMNFGYEDMSETSGPYEITCPPSLLDVLSPLKPVVEGSPEKLKWATDFRDRCRSHAAKMRPPTFWQLLFLLAVLGTPVIFVIWMSKP